MEVKETGLDKLPKVCIYLTEGEKSLIDALRGMEYGEVTIEVVKGQPWRILKGVESRKL